MNLPSHLDPTPCKPLDQCAGACGHVVKQVAVQNGRWFITMGHPGFNLPANNGRGYASKAKALAAHARCGGSGR